LGNGSGLLPVENIFLKVDSGIQVLEAPVSKSHDDLLAPNKMSILGLERSLFRSFKF
jgi:hypothetical protein